MEVGKTDRIVLAHSKEIEEAKQEYPEMAERINVFIQDFQKTLGNLSQEIENIDYIADQELVKVVLINGIHKITDQVFL